MRVPSSRSLAAALPLLLAIAGCASGGGTSSRPQGATPDRIVQEELTAVGDLDAYDAVSRLRPNWLRSRAGTSPPVVYMNGSRYGNDPSSLRSFQARSIQQIEHINGPDASTRFGTGHDGGAILVTLAGR
jgi:hypothetical protein